MAVVFIHPVTAELHYRHDREDERRFPLPAGVTALVRFDKQTNLVLFQDIQNLAHTGRYTIEAGVLKKDGNTITPAADSTQYGDGLLIVLLDGDIDALLGGMTQAQLQVIVRRGLRILRYLLRRLKEKNG